MADHRPHTGEEVTRQLEEKVEDRAEEQAVEEALKEKVDELEKTKAESAEYLEQLQRSQAEFANYKKRVERERDEFVSLANAALISRLLPILDDCERALHTVPDNLQGLTWVEGIFLIERRLRITLEQEGLAEIEAAGKKFDPELHHAAVREETTEYEEDAIISELQKGYKLNDKVLRPSMVRVAARPSDRSKEQTE
jgi:molecular chaperone GrpE